MLPDIEREDISSKILAPVDNDGDSYPGAEVAWDEEIAKRIAEIDSGKVKGLTHEEVMDQLRAEFKWDR